MLHHFSKALASFTLVLGLLAAAGAAQAQNISQPSGNFVAGATGFGQTFTATVTGNVTQIIVRPRTTANNVRFYFFNGPGSGTSGSNASAVSSQLVDLVDTGGDSIGGQVITLDTPLPVVAGNQYAYAVDAVVAFAVDTSEPYAGGSPIVNYNDVQGGYDSAFTIVQVAPAPVPTLTEWAMILFGLTLAGGAVLMIQRRRMVAA